MVEQVQFGLVGAGYWTERYFMVARELPERFRERSGGHNVSGATM
jgi:hypothetical protein